jgi:hypothetical protein
MVGWASGGDHEAVSLNILAERAADALRVACSRVGLDGRGAVLLRPHSNVVFRLVREPVVVRIAPSAATFPRAANAVRVTRWLTGLGFPTVVPVPEIEQPIVADEHVVTFWRYLPQPAGKPHVADLGRLLAEFHALPMPPFTLPRNRPMERLRQAMAESRALTGEQEAFLAGRCERLLEEYGRLQFVLPPGLIHGDAH